MFDTGKTEWARALGFSLTLVVAGCTLTPQEGQFGCNSDEDCPPGWVCNSAGDNSCYSDEDEFPGTDSDSDSDTDADTDTDTDSDVDECSFDCMSEALCSELEGEVVEDQSCENEDEVCCDYGSDTDTDTDTDVDTDTDTDVDTDTDTDVDTDTDTDVDTDTDTDSDTGTGSDTGLPDCPFDCIGSALCTAMSGTIHDEFACESVLEVCCEYGGDTDTGSDTGSNTGSDTDTTCSDLLAGIVYDFEGVSCDLMGWTLSGDWELGADTYPAPYEGSCEVGTVIGGDYNDSTTSEALSPTLDLSDCDGSTVLLSWYGWRRMHPSDDLYVDVYSSGVWYDGVESYTGNAEAWTLYATDVSIFLTDDFQIRFRMVADSNGNREGPYFDYLVFNLL